MVPLPNQRTAVPPPRMILGPLEARVMEALWNRGPCSVRDVLAHLNQAIAYTTVMTTLERLYKKELVNRKRRGRAFVYSAELTREQWIGAVARDLAEKLLICPWPSHEVLISCLLEVVKLKKPELLEKIVRTLDTRDIELLSSGYNAT